MSDDSITTVLVITAGDGTGLNFTRSLRRAGGYRVIGMDTTLDDLIVSEADDRLLVDEESEELFVDTVNRVCVSRGVDLVYAADTNRPLELLSRNRKRISAPTFLPDREDHLLAEDKWATFSGLSTLDFPCQQLC